MAACQHLTAELGQAQADLGLDDSSDEDEDGNELEEGEIPGDDVEDDYHLGLARHRGTKGTSINQSSGVDVTSGVGWGATGGL